MENRYIESAGRAYQRLRRDANDNALALQQRPAGPSTEIVGANSAGSSACRPAHLLFLRDTFHLERTLRRASPPERLSAIANLLRNYGVPEADNVARDVVYSPVTEVFSRDAPRRHATHVIGASVAHAAHEPNQAAAISSLQQTAHLSRPDAEFVVGDSFQRLIPETRVRARGTTPVNFDFLVSPMNEAQPHAPAEPEFAISPQEFQSMIRSEGIRAHQQVYGGGYVHNGAPAPSLSERASATFRDATQILNGPNSVRAFLRRVFG